MANNMTNVQHPNQQFHISSNPLDELFNVHGSPHNPHPVPMAQRRLPPSFFRPPSASSSAAHSRESSLDAGSCAFSPKQTSSGKPPTPIAACSSPLSPASPPTGQQQLVQVNHQILANKTTPPPAPPSGLEINHSRTRSLPATLQSFSYSLPNGANGNQQVQQQMQQQLQQQQQQQPQPQQSPQVKAIQQQQNFHARQHSYDINKIQLPEGWSMSFTPNGDRYFLNHKEKITTWEDPRKELLRRELQNANSNSIAQIAQSRQQLSTAPSYSSQPNMQQVMQQQQFAESRFDPANVPLPEGWEQTRTPNGDLYYVNNNEQSTSWFHPSLPRQLQLKVVQLKQQSSGVQPPSFLYTMQQMMVTTTTSNGNNGNSAIPAELVVALENMNTSGHPTEQQATTDLLRQLQQNSNVRELERERERMRQRQEELMQSSLLKTNFFTTQSSDPFLSSVDNHVRQESVDSGLSLGSVSGMNGSHLTLNNCAINNGFGSEQTMTEQNGNQANHNLFSSPDELLTTMDHFTTNSSSNNNNASNQHRMNHSNAPHSVPGVANHVDDLSFIDSIDLVQNLDMDILTDMEDLLNSNRDNLAWL